MLTITFSCYCTVDDDDECLHLYDAGHQPFGMAPVQLHVCGMSCRVDVTCLRGQFEETFGNSIQHQCNYILRITHQKKRIVLMIYLYIARPLKCLFFLIN